MKISGMEIPDAVVDAIVAKAKTKELFKEFFEELKLEWNSLRRNQYVSKELAFRRSIHPKYKVAVKMEYHNDSLEISYYVGPGDVVTVVLYVTAYDLSKTHDRLLKHIKKTYHIDCAEYYPILFVDDGVVEFELKTSPQLPRLISDIKETIPESEVELISDGILRIKI